MPTVYQNTQWLSHNAQRRYPLADDADGIDETETFELPNDFILGLDLPIHAGMDVDPARFFLKHVGSYGASGYFITVGYQPASGDAVNVATCLVARQGLQPNTTFVLGGVEPFDDTVGKVTIGQLGNIDLEPAGFFTFTLEHTRLDPDAIRPMIRGVSSITLVNGSETSEPLYGDVVIEAGSNIQLVPITEDGEDPIIRINAVSGEGTVEECVCEGESAPKSPIYTISGIKPRLNGEFTLVGGECVTLEPITNGLRVTNTCSQPCCGCADLERITQDLVNFGSQVQAVIDFSSNLRSSVDAMDLVVLGAKLGDKGCS